jgi:hypothetical protein
VVRWSLKVEKSIHRRCSTTAVSLIMVAAIEGVPLR